MDDYLRNSLFASNLLEFLLLKINIPWELSNTSIIKDCLKTEFDEEIGVAVYTIWKRNALDVRECYSELRQQQEDDDVEEEVIINYKKAQHFSKCALSAADSYFSKGYNPGSFLGYCAIVLGVATDYFQVPTQNVPEMAVEVIALVLLAHQLTGQFYKHDGWEGLRQISFQFNCLPKNIQFLENEPNFYVW